MRALLEKVYMAHPIDFTGHLAEISEGVHLTFLQKDSSLKIISNTVSSTPDGCEFCPSSTLYYPKNTELAQVFFPFKEVTCIHVTNAEINSVAKVNTDIMEVYFYDNGIYALLPMSLRGRNILKMRMNGPSCKSKAFDENVARINLNTNVVDVYSYQPKIGLTEGDLFLNTVAINRLDEKTEAKK